MHKTIIIITISVLVILATGYYGVSIIQKPLKSQLNDDNSTAKEEPVVSGESHTAQLLVKSAYKSKDNIVQNIKIDASNYKISKVSADYDSIDIQGFEQPPSGLKLPYLKYTINLPLDVKVNNVKVDFGEQVNLGKLNIPIYQEMTCAIECSPATFKPNLEKLGIFSNKQFEYTAKNYDGRSTEVSIIIHPVTFDGETTEAILFKSININLDYTSATKGYFISANKNKQEYTAGENIVESISVKNTSPDSNSFKATVELKNLSDQTVAVKSQEAIVAPEKEGVIIVHLPIPNISGNYNVVTTVYSGKNIINTTNDDIQIKPKQNVEIVSLKVSEKVSKSKQQYKDYITSIATINNPTSDSFRAFVDFYIYDDDVRLITKRLQMYVDLGPNETKDVEDTWFVTSLEPGKYLVQAFASVGSFETSSSMESFEVVP